MTYVKMPKITKLFIISLVLLALYIPISYAGNVTFTGFNDTDVTQGAPTSSHGTATYLYIQDNSGNNYRSYYFLDYSAYSNISVTPASAVLLLNVNERSGSANFIYQYCNISYFPTDTVTWNNQGNYTTACATLGTVATYASTGQKSLDIKQAFNKTVGGTKKFLIRLKYVTESAGTSYWGSYAKENVDTVRRPKIQLTLGTAPVTNSCTWGGSGNWNVRLEDNCTITSTVDIGANYLKINGTRGNFTVSTNGKVYCRQKWFKPTDFNGDARVITKVGGVLATKP